MSRETPDEVREFAENCGYPTVECRNETHPGNYCVSRGGIHSRLNFLNDLNACFEALEWFCGKHGLYSGLLSWGTAHDCYITQPGFGIFEDKPFRHHASGTKCEAIIRAVNAAAKARSR